MARVYHSLLQNDAKARKGNRAHREHRSKNGRRKLDRHGKERLKTWTKERGERLERKRFRGFVLRLVREHSST